MPGIIGMHCPYNALLLELVPKDEFTHTGHLRDVLHRHTVDDVINLEDAAYCLSSEVDGAE